MRGEQFRQKTEAFGDDPGPAGHGFKKLA